MMLLRNTLFCALGVAFTAGSLSARQSDWTETDKLFAPVPLFADQYARSVAVHEGTLVVGSLEPSGSPQVREGAAYVYSRSPTGWTLQERLQAPDKAIFDNFGLDVSIWDGTIAVGTPRDDNENGTDAGSVYVFESSSGAWQFQTKIIPGDSDTNDFFG